MRLILLLVAANLVNSHKIQDNFDTKFQVNISEVNKNLTENSQEISKLSQSDLNGNGNSGETEIDKNVDDFGWMVPIELNENSELLTDDYDHPKSNRGEPWKSFYSDLNSQQQINPLQQNPSNKYFSGKERRQYGPTTPVHLLGWHPRPTWVTLWRNRQQNRASGRNSHHNANGQGEDDNGQGWPTEPEVVRSDSPPKLKRLNISHNEDKSESELWSKINSSLTEIPFSSTVGRTSPLPHVTTDHQHISSSSSSHLGRAIVNNKDRDEPTTDVINDTNITWINETNTILDTGFNISSRDEQLFLTFSDYFGHGYYIVIAVCVTSFAVGNFVIMYLMFFKRKKIQSSVRTRSFSDSDMY